jgi:hypothetical protein
MNFCEGFGFYLEFRSKIKLRGYTKVLKKCDQRAKIEQVYFSFEKRRMSRLKANNNQYDLLFHILNPR